MDVSVHQSNGKNRYIEFLSVIIEDSQKHNPLKICIENNILIICIQNYMKTSALFASSRMRQIFEFNFLHIVNI